MSEGPQYRSAPTPPGYPPQGYPAPPTNTMAILSLVFAFLFWPLAIVFGHIARRQIARTGERGRGLATAGLVLGYLFLALIVLALVLAFVVLAVGGEQGVTNPG